MTDGETRLLAMIRGCVEHIGHLNAALDRAIEDGHQRKGGAGCTCGARADDGGIAEDDPRPDEEIVASWFATHVADYRKTLLEAESTRTEEVTE